MTKNIQIDTVEKPRFSFTKNSSSTSVTANFRGVPLQFNLSKRPGSPYYQAKRKIDGKLVPYSTGTANLEAAAVKGAEFFSQRLCLPWTDAANDVVVPTRGIDSSSCQDVIDAFEAAAKAGKLITKGNRELGSKSVRDYPAALRLILGFGNDPSIKGVPTEVTDALRKIPVSDLGVLVNGDNTKVNVVDRYRRRILDNGQGGLYKAGPTYESKAKTFNSNLKKAKALFTPLYSEAAYSELDIPQADVDRFRASKPLGVEKGNGYEAPPNEVVYSLDDKAIRLRDELVKADKADQALGRYSKVLAAQWNHLVKYFIARLSGLRKDEINHLSFSSFRKADKAARNTRTGEVVTASYTNVTIRTTDPYRVGRFEQEEWQAKGKARRSIQIPRWLFDFIKAEQKRRGAKSDERIFRGQEFWSQSTLDGQHDTWWNEDLLYGEEAADYFKKRLHELRALFGSEVVTQTGSLYAAQIALGHENYKTTEQHYSHLLVEFDFELKLKGA